MNWAAYLERKFTISENITAEMKRKQKRLRKVGSYNPSFISAGRGREDAF
jgi:hypothetical protein